MYFHLLYFGRPSIAHCHIKYVSANVFSICIKLAAQGMIITLTNKCTSEHWRDISENTKPNQLSAAATAAVLYSWSNCSTRDHLIGILCAMAFYFQCQHICMDINGYIYVPNHMPAAHHGIVSWMLKCVQGKCGKYRLSCIWTSMIQHFGIRFDSKLKQIFVQNEIGVLGTWEKYDWIIIRTVIGFWKSASKFYWIRRDLSGAKQAVCVRARGKERRGDKENQWVFGSEF